MPQLLIVKGPNTGVAYQLTDRTRIGRLGENEIQVPDPNVSRIHAEIIREADGLTVYDRGSKNGVIVNGEEVAEKVLQPGDEMTIGCASFILDGPLEIRNARFSCTPLYYLPEGSVESLKPVSMKNGKGTADATGIIELAQVFVSAKKNLPSATSTVCEGLLAWSGASSVVLLLRDFPTGDVYPIEAAPRINTVFTAREIIKQCIDAQQAMTATINLDWELLDKYIDSGEESSSPGRTKPSGRLDKITCIAAPLEPSSAVSGVIILSYNDGREIPASIQQAITSVAALTGLALNAASVKQPDTVSDNSPLDAEQRSASSRSLRMQEIYNSAKRSADGNAPILITGETGTGKETLARFIHESSERAAGPFLVVSLAELGADQLESALFGTQLVDENGSHSVQQGAVDDAAGGTLYLEEISELTLGFQPKLLRFLQDRAYCRMNSDCAVIADVKVIASSSIDLAAAVRSGSFREDLWYRLNVVPFHMPPLRERREDVAPLIDAFINLYSTRLNRRVIGANDSAIALCQKYDWPGNIRELNNAVERAVLLAESKVLSTSDFSHIEEARRQLNANSDLERRRDTRPLAEVERRHVIIALKKHNFNQARAAEALGLHRNTLRNKIIEYGIEIPK